MALSSDSAVLIGFIATLGVVGIAGAATLVVFVCLRWRDYRKRRAVTVAPLPSRQRSRRRRSRLSHNIHGPLPPPYSDEDCPPPYTAVDASPHLRREDNTRGSISGQLTPVPESARGGNVALHRNPHFGTHLNTGGTNTPVATPGGSMFRSSVPSTREHSASSHVRSMDMVHLDTRAHPLDVPHLTFSNTSENG
ncbi:uncharacterized protein LOC128235866 [Mya arenaria]|uniref:uncharacterized protein LOC128235866 n=1 Tax=Mya arenaria TaxID=6604 RepID=UPI0022E0465F|nr:uncharacterized protein LOC128235866 [Mya arenaria]